MILIDRAGVAVPRVLSLRDNSKNKQWMTTDEISELIKEGTCTSSNQGRQTLQKRLRSRENEEERARRKQQSDHSEVHSRLPVDAANHKLSTICAPQPAIGCY